IYLQKKNAAAAETPVAAVGAKAYRLQTDDILVVTIKAIDPALVSIFNPGNDDANQMTAQSSYFNGFTVDDHGNIRIPILGSLNVLGYTVDEVRQQIEKQLLETYFNEAANIFVSVKLSGLRFTVNGEVTAPGTITLYQERVNVLEAVANA